MNQYKVTFKRVGAFYESIFIEASSEEEARQQADNLSDKGEIEFDYCKESDILDDYILDVEKIN
jgi:ribosomal protein S18